MFSKLCDDIHATDVKYGAFPRSAGYPHIAQYKEKMSELRVYVDCSSKKVRDEINPLIEKACRESVSICSGRGEPDNKINTDKSGYYRNFCDSCEKAYQKETRSR